MKPACRINIKVVPGASKNQVAEWLGDTLKIRIRAKAQKGQANEALVRFLAGVLDINPKQIQISRGLTHSRKTVDFVGLSQEKIKLKLMPPVAKIKSS